MMNYLFATLNLSKLDVSHKRWAIQDDDLYPDKVYFLTNNYPMPLVTLEIIDGEMMFPKSMDWILVAKSTGKEYVDVVVVFSNETEYKKFEDNGILKNFKGRDQNRYDQLWSSGPVLGTRIFSFKSDLTMFEFDRINVLINEFITKTIGDTNSLRIEIDKNRLIINALFGTDPDDKQSSIHYVNLCMEIDTIKKIRSIDGIYPFFMEYLKGSTGNG